MIIYFANLGVSILFCLTLHGQYYYYSSRFYSEAVHAEAGINAGFMNACTDLGGNNSSSANFLKDVRFKTAMPSAGVYLLAMFRNLFALRLETTHGKVVAYDSILNPYSTIASGRYQRNLSFQSKIREWQLAFEIHLPAHFSEMHEAPILSYYLLAGAGRFHFNPEAMLNGQWYALQPLSTEGQGFTQFPERRKYKLVQNNLIAGTGIRYEWPSCLVLRLEIVHRFLFTDYLDDVSTTYIDPALYHINLSQNLSMIAEQLSNRKKERDPSLISLPGDQRGNPRQRDSYFTVQLKLGISFGRSKR